MSEQKKNRHYRGIVYTGLVTLIVSLVLAYFSFYLEKTYTYQVRCVFPESCVFEEHTNLTITQMKEELRVIPIQKDVYEIELDTELNNRKLRLKPESNQYNSVDSFKLSGKVLSVYLKCAPDDTRQSASTTPRETKTTTEKVQSSSSQKKDTSFASSLAQKQTIVTKGKILGAGIFTNQLEVSFLDQTVLVNENGNFEVQSAFFDDYALLEVYYKNKIVANENYYPGSFIKIEVDSSAILDHNSVR